MLERFIRFGAARSWMLLGACVGALLSLTPKPAWAGSCSCLAPSAQILPSNGWQEVPVNTKTWVLRAQHCGIPSLATRGGTEVLTTHSRLDADVLVLTPEHPLEAGEQYEVHCPEGKVSSFTVADGQDWSAPSTPKFAVGDRVSVTSEGFGDCGDMDYATLRVDHDGALLVLASQAETQEEGLTGKGLLDAWGGDDRVTVGDPGACGTPNWDFLADGPLRGARLAAVDLAGNVSGWSEATHVAGLGSGFELGGKMPEPSDADVVWGDERSVMGCAVGPVTPAVGGVPALAAMGFVLLCVGRRFRRSAVSRAHRS